MRDLILPKFAEHADIGHLALIIVVGGLSAAWQMTFRELAAANRRFDTFVRELARFNQRLERDDP
jgi:hypothetical protein